MRGKVIRALECAAIIRITPAYAGKRQLSTLYTPCPWDHPRLCGEKMTEHFQNQFQTGSPPPMRGKASSFENPADCSGITPAYAGKRHSLFHSPEVEQDHPRLCGEKPHYRVAPISK